VNVSRKAAFSLLISILLFAVFAALAFTGLFDLVEARFYNPAVARAIGREIDADSQIIEDFFKELQIRFAATLEDGAVRRSLLADMESEDVALRADLYGRLLESLGGLQSVRFIDSGGRRIHFSTWAPDILPRDRNPLAYRNYGAKENSAAYIPYGQLESTAPALILDGPGERIVFAHPFYDSFDVYRGTALFSLSVRAVTDTLISAGRIKIGEDVSLVSEPPGLVIGLPPVGRNVLLPLIARVWSENSLSLGRLNSDLTGAKLALISRKMGQNIYLGRLVNESLLSFPLAMRIILLISFFITVCLVVFLFFSFRQDDITIIQSRLKKLQLTLLKEYYEQMEDLSWNRWRRELEHRREDIHAELKRGLKTRAGAGGFAELDGFIDRSWDDLMAITDGHLERRAGIDEDTLKALLSRLLRETGTAPQALDKAGAIGALSEADVMEALEGPFEEIAAPETPEPEIEELGEIEELEDVDAAEFELEELETLEPELADPDPAGADFAEAESEGLAAAAGPEMPGDPAGAEAAEPELVELEAVEPELFEPDAMTGFYELEPVEFDDDSDESEAVIDNVVRAVEFSPEPRELERKKEKAAKSMAAQVEIQSPFASIFSTLSELEFAPEPMEDLESLERERQEPDDSPETEAEALPFIFTGPQLSIPFLGALNSEIIVLMAEDDDEDTPAAPEEAEAEELEGEEAGDDRVITERDGLLYINESVLRPDKETLKGLDKNFKNLIDSILNKS
jgi:hypothetical protein